MDIAVVDYGMGNLRSVAKALVHVAPTRSIVVTSDPDAIRRAGRVVLPVWRASSVIELKAGFLDSHPLRIGEKLHVDPALS